MKKLMTSDDEKKVKELITAGKKPVEISRELGFPYPVIYYYVKKNCIYKRCHKFTDKEVRYLMENYSTMSVAEMSKALDIPVESLYNKARGLDIAKFRRK